MTKGWKNNPQQQHQQQQQQRRDQEGSYDLSSDFFPSLQAANQQSSPPEAPQANVNVKHHTSRSRPFRPPYNKYCWYDITRVEDGDAIFQAILGANNTTSSSSSKDDDGATIGLPPDLARLLELDKIVTNPTALSHAVQRLETDDMIVALLASMSMNNSHKRNHQPTTSVEDYSLPTNNSRRTTNNTPKDRLLDFCQRKRHQEPIYQTQSYQALGEDLVKWEATVRIELNNGETLCVDNNNNDNHDEDAYCLSREQAECSAAKQTLERLMSMLIMEDNEEVSELEETTKNTLSTTTSESSFILPIRAAARRHLPFAVQFVLELAIMGRQDPQAIPLTIPKRPRGHQHAADHGIHRMKNPLILQARKLILVFWHVALPPLLELDYDYSNSSSNSSSSSNNSSSSSSNNSRSSSITLSQLFAHELLPILLQIKQDITKGRSFETIRSQIHLAYSRARGSLRLAETVLGVTEAQLLSRGGSSSSSSSSKKGLPHLQLLQLRARWPMAEYRCKVSKSTGQLVPIDMELINKPAPNGMRLSATTRRVMREEFGWNVRDRFLLISSIPLEEPYTSQLIPWLQAKPCLCGRTYEYLFDKGTGKPDVWLFANDDDDGHGEKGATTTTTAMTRDKLLQQLGDFRRVTPTKVGDRISLSFTQTAPVAYLELSDIVAIPEVVRNGFVFSDGSGVMGRGIAEIIQKALGYKSLPGAAQIRIGGVKGMLSLNRGFPPYKIGIRPSMVKLPSNLRVLEVKRVPEYNSNVENKLFNQILLIMHHLRVPNRVFLDLQAKAVANMALKFEDEKPNLADYNSAYVYLKQVVKFGLKSNGSPFEPEEIASLRRTMVEAKNKVNLRCDVALCVGVPDEHGILGEGEVLVGNGRIRGPVLVCRSPCNMPGDIQKAYAIEASRDSEHLNGVIVFSTQGSRPLADCLAGGDYDGDEYYIIREQSLIGLLQVSKAHDFGSQKEENTIPRTVDISDAFVCGPLVPPPDISEQLQGFSGLLKLGNLVGKSSDAWMRVADSDIQGPGSPRAIRIAQTCLAALDARKLAASFSESQLLEINGVLQEIHRPHWKGGGGGPSRQSSSILGILYDKWCQWIHDLERSGKRYERLNQLIERQGKAHVDMDDDDAFSVVSKAHECVVCSAEGDVSCSFCSQEVWLCSEGDCKANHWHEMGHGDSNVKAFEYPILEQEITIDIAATNMSSPMETLLSVTFRRLRPSLSATSHIDGRVVNASDLCLLESMVLIEYDHCLRDAILQANDRWPKYQDIPRPLDVFTRNSDSYRQGSELLVYLPDPELPDELAWFDEVGEKIKTEEVDYQCRVGSLSGALRVIESLRSTSLLKTKAMLREQIYTVEECSTGQNAQEGSRQLNPSQHQVVEAFRGLQSKEGFLVVQGPPGTGKTTTVISMVTTVRSGILLVAPSNTAVANLATRLVQECDGFGIENVVVWGINCDEQCKFLNPVHRFNRWSREDPEIRRWLNLPDNALPKYIEEICSLPPLSALERADVICCTLNTAGSHDLRAAMRGIHTVIVDEAGQCTEAEFYIATTVPGVRRIVAIGDPQQLPATVLTQECKDKGYGRSFLANVFNHHGEKKVFCLNVQYRMDRKIFAFSNENFYDSRVLSMTSWQPEIERPFAMINTSEMGKEKRVNSSWINENEAVVIREVLSNDADIIKLRETMNPLIFIITPYSAQLKYLRGSLKKLQKKSGYNIRVATIDQIQGQEADVVIYSTVRTQGAGFTDDAQRMNVALTRAKRIVRIIGDFNFFMAQPEYSSVLRKLAMYCKREKLLLPSTTTAAWRPPDWKTVTTWKPVLTSSFHHSLKAVSGLRKNVAMNTLLAVCVPRLNELRKRPTEERSWQVSSLKAFNKDLCIVWLPLECETVTAASVTEDVLTYTGVIRTTFAGPYNRCLHYVQTHPVLPVTARVIKRDLTGLVATADFRIPAAAPSLDLSWLVTNDLQDGLDRIDELPEGIFDLDADQARILNCPPPLLLESRSGTGKTNVLFQHAVKYSRRLAGDDRQKSICFITVSPKLRQELQRRYEEVQAMYEIQLVPILFFSFGDFLERLLQTFSKYEVSDVDVDDTATFLQYLRERRNQSALRREQSLIENEIGGVILGSLKAAEKGEALTRTEYLQERRSNVSKDDAEGQSTRSDVFSEYQLYDHWKNDRHDIDDIVLHLIRRIHEIGVNDGSVEIFQSVYLDEVQDFSYAKLYLICSVAGRLKRQWIAAGDTAQMISSGCSFTFSGMKEVLRAIQGGDVTLGKVQRLKRNYRLTKSVLDVGNAIVRVLKEKFPGVIEYSQPEVAMKDLGLDVILIDWKEGFGQKVKFGTQQALIYSTGTGQIKKSGTQEEDRDLKTKIDAFLPDHPFTLSSLESKGLEFQDVVVVFDFSHGAWNITDRKANPQESIKLLRELYVAVTRARGRLVIFVRNREKFPYMYSFFRDLECGINTDVFANVDTLRLEFDNETTGHMWFQKGKEMFEEEQFRLAASCFKSAESYGWMNRAFGKFFLLSRGRNSDAKDAFRKSAKQFYEDEEYERCLDVYRDILDLPPWDERDNELLDSSLEKRPHYLSRRWMLQLAIKRNAWHVIQRGDLVDPSTSDLFKLYQMHEHIEEILSASSDEELADIANVLPIAVASHYLEKHRYREAVDLYLQNGSQDDVRRTVDAMDTDDREKQATIRVVAKHYHRMDDMERCLDHLKRLYDLPLPWDTEDNAMVHNALVQCPSYLGRVDQTKLCLASDFWDMIESTDLQPALKPLFAKYRERPEMEVLILSCSKKELARIAGVLPNIVGDYYFNKSSYTEARKLYTRGKDKTRAAEADKKLKEAKKKQVPTPKPKQVRVPPTSVPRSPPAVASTAGIDSSSSSDGSDMRDLSSAFAIDSSSSGDMPKVLPKSHTTGKKSKRRSARKPAPKAPPPVDGAFPVGTRVRLKSLKTAQHLNHKTGIVATPLNEDRRQGITMDAPSLGVKAVKPENLELMAAKDNDSSNEDDSDLPTLVPRMGHYNSNSSGSDSDSEPPDLLGPGGDDSSSDDYDDMPPLQMRGRNDSSSDDDRPRSRRGH